MVLWSHNVLTKGADVLDASCDDLGRASSISTDDSQMSRTEAQRSQGQCAKSSDAEGVCGRGGQSSEPADLTDPQVRSETEEELDDPDNMFLRSAEIDVGLDATAYPTDEPMRNEMMEYRRAVEPNLSIEDREVLNSVREAWMAGGGGSAPRSFRELVSTNDTGGTMVTVTAAESWTRAAMGCRQLAHVGAQFLLEFCGDELVGSSGDGDGTFRMPQMRIGSSSCEVMPPSAQPFLLGALGTAVSWVQAIVGLDIHFNSAAVSQLFERHIGTLNVLIWIVLLELLHGSLNWFSALGLPSMTTLLQQLTSPFLLRCYYALMVRAAPENSHYPLLAEMRELLRTALRGIKSPARMRPPVFRMIILARVMCLLQSVLHCWFALLRG
eukprot:TRINITY_DN49862_c0_g1_i1.p1 TRINITY_DN49862_c0_g1~~TRINITY_DN49862_c0_g1_i1.p1  ORF type:complete len:383 (+),score=47.58 TRINITY_DN49862_c0_g1_i1:100-1248(+)